MKKIAISFALIFCIHYAMAQITVDSSYANGYYQQRLEFFMKMPTHAHEIVFLGNSITEAGEWQELFASKRNVINRGISGDVSFGVIARLNEVLSAQPDQIFLLIGINDLKRGIPQEMLLRNYERIFKRIKEASPKTKLIAQSILPINESMISNDYKRISNLKINEVNQALLKLAKQYQITYLDLHPLFEDQSGQLKKEYTTDGIHLKMPAYILWASYIKQQKLL